MLLIASIVIAFIFLAALFAVGCELVRLLLEVEDMPEDVTPVRRRVRFYESLPGDDLATGIRRAFILSHEWAPVCLVHDNTAVMVFEDSTPYTIESEWKATRKLQSALMHCNGK